MSEIRYCESCGMPLDSNEVLGSNSDNSKSFIAIKMELLLPIVQWMK